MHGVREALKVNSSLKIIDLFYNKIGAEGAGKIAEALKVNSSLQSINLGYSNIGAEGAGKDRRSLESEFFSEEY
jgi:Ran GTPase-activating protein (RanGAP) involved in mRNA processing and transport